MYKSFPRVVLLYIGTLYFAPCDLIFNHVAHGAEVCFCKEAYQLTCRVISA